MPTPFQLLLQRYGGTPGSVPSYRPRPRSTFGKVLDYLDRPRASLHEAIGAMGADEDVTEAAWRGLTKGAVQSKYGTLGAKLFPTSVEQGFQGSDIGAFVVDALVDPINLLGAGLAKTGARAGAKLVLRGAQKFVPPIKPVLEGVEAMTTPISAMKALRKELGDLGLSYGEASRRLANLSADPKSALPLVSHQDLKGLLKLKPKRLTSRKGVPSQALLRNLPSTKETLATMGGRSGYVDPLEYIEMLRGSLRQLDINFRPSVQTSLHSLMANFGRVLAPPGKIARVIGGRAGTRIAQGVKRADYRTAIRYRSYDEQFKELLTPYRKIDREAASMLHEGIAVVDPTTGRLTASPDFPKLNLTKYLGGTPDVAAAQRLRPEIDKFTRTFYDDEILNPKNFDPWGRTMEAYDPTTKKWMSLEEARIGKGYYPRKYPPEMFDSKGIDKFQKRLINAGMSERDASRTVERNLRHSPKRIGHLEYVRKRNKLGYEHDPAVVLPKYTYDAIKRQELAREFGTKNEILSSATDDMIKMGVNKGWAESLSDLITGTNRYDRAMDELFGTLNTIQGVSKLGYATTVANMTQGPFNQSIRSGFINTARSAYRTMRGHEDLAHLGPLAFTRSTRKDIANAATGMRSKFGDGYMKLTGFNWSEKAGRHLGAIGGDMELSNMARKWRAAREAGDTARATRVASELNRKYGDVVSYDDLVRHNGELPRELLDMGALEAANVTMHAFGTMDLPIQWRDPFWRMLLQFKSFIYKQTEFMASEVVAPGLRYLATDGAKGSIGPLLRAMVAVPPTAIAVTHMRDWAKSVPSHLWSLGTKGEPAQWDYRDPFWEDPDPASRFMTDAIYIGTLGLIGDMFETASHGRTADWLVGPTIGDITDILEAAASERRMGPVITRMVTPGGLGIPPRADLFDKLQKALR